MATFKGTIQEFHGYIGPRVRNVINNFTRKLRKKKNGICEFCKQKAELQSAHVHGRGRRAIIEAVLKNYTDEKGQIFCSIENVESEILDAHMPIEETFKFICHPCHVKYDAKSTKNKNTRDQNGINKSNAPEFTKLSRIKLWAKRPHQINSRIINAYLKLENDGVVSYSSLKSLCMDEFSVENFDSHFASMKTDKGNSHGAIFYEEGNIVKIWDRARTEIDLNFKKI